MSLVPRPLISVADALKHNKLFGPFFIGSSWNTWRAVLKAAFAEKLTATELTTFRTVAEREPPAHRVKELVAVVGRGGGKDSVASFVAAYVAMSFDPIAASLRPGESVFVLCIAVDKDQAAIVFRYIKALFEETPTLRAMVTNFGSDSIELNNRVVIEVRTNSFRSVRGRSILAAIFDEAAFWRDERSANPDIELHGAVSPGLARVVNSLLILISSAHRRSGLLYERWKQFFGTDDDDVLVVRGGTRTFNPTFDQGVIDKAITLDPQRYSAEYGSEWRDDLSTFLTREQLEAVLEVGVTARPPQTNIVYYAFTDPSGGGADAFTLSIAHRELHQGTDRVVVDLLFESHSPNPAEVVAEITKLLRNYRCEAVTGDRYAAQWVVEAFRKHGIQYVHSQLDRSELYLGFAPLVRSGQLLLIDSPRAVYQFINLERRTFSTGKDKVDHPRGAHDDLANAIAGAAVLASRKLAEVPIVIPMIVSKDGDAGPGLNPLTGKQMTTTEAFYAAGGGLSSPAGISSKWGWTV